MDCTRHEPPTSIARIPAGSTIFPRRRSANLPLQLFQFADETMVARGPGAGHHHADGLSGGGVVLGSERRIEQRSRSLEQGGAMGNGIVGTPPTHQAASSACDRLRPADFRAWPAEARAVAPDNEADAGRAAAPGAGPASVTISGSSPAGGGEAGSFAFFAPRPGEGRAAAPEACLASGTIFPAVGRPAVWRPVFAPLHRGRVKGARRRPAPARCRSRFPAGPRWLDQGRRRPQAQRPLSPRDGAAVRLAAFSIQRRISSCDPGLSTRRAHGRFSGGVAWPRLRVLPPRKLAAS